MSVAAALEVEHPRAPAVLCDDAVSIGGEECRHALVGTGRHHPRQRLESLIATGRRESQQRRTLGVEVGDASTVPRPLDGGQRSAVTTPDAHPGAAVIAHHDGGGLVRRRQVGRARVRVLMIERRNRPRPVDAGGFGDRAVDDVATRCAEQAEQRVDRLVRQPARVESRALDPRQPLLLANAEQLAVVGNGGAAMACGAAQPEAQRLR